MSIALDNRNFGRLLDIVMPGASPNPAEARAVLHIAQLAAGIDLDDDLAERGLLGTLTVLLCDAAMIPLDSVRPLSPLPIDAEERRAQIASLAGRLVSTESRELAYILAYLLIVADLELAPVESDLLDDLRRALWIDGDRAGELAAEVSVLVTPGTSGSESELEGASAHL